MNIACSRGSRRPSSFWWSRCRNFSSAKAPRCPRIMFRPRSRFNLTIHAPPTLRLFNTAAFAVQQRMRSVTLVRMWTALVLGGIFVWQAAQAAAPAAQNPGAQAAASIDAQAAAKQSARDADYTRAMASGADFYTNRKFIDAAHSFEQAVALKPDSDQAQFWAGQSLVYARQPNAAISYLESATREGSGDSVGVHLALVSAYAGASPPHLAELDRERALLHKWHDEGTHGNIVNQSGFLMETFYTRQWHVNVVEYFAP